MILNINDREIVQFTNRLERMHRKHLPIVIRNTLNEVALKGVKQKTLLSTTKKEFEERRKTFFKANSRVNFAKGWDIKRMQSEVGMSSHRLASNNYAVKDLEAQERGGRIKGKSFIPLKQARVGNSWNRMVRKKYRLSQINNVVDAKKNRQGKKDETRWIRSAIFAGKNGFVLGTKVNSSGARTLFQIKNIRRTKKGTSINATPIYSVRSNRSVKVKSTKFMEKSANAAAPSINQVFLKNAKNELAR